MVEKIEKYKKHQAKYKALEEKLKVSGETQISTSDPESRHLAIRGNITEVAYSVQASTDAKHNIPIDYEVTNENDTNAMGDILSRSKDVIGHNNFTGLFDKGYHTGAELKKAFDLEIDVLVSIPRKGKPSQAPDPRYNSENFVCGNESDTYTCPAG